jgi:hypothetical protein
MPSERNAPPGARPKMQPTNSEGYRGPGYAQSLVHVGQPVALERSGGWCLLRSIEGAGCCDATGPYPFYVCDDWSRLAEDVAALAETAVSLTIVTDPFADVSQDSLFKIFPDLCLAYKHHYVVHMGTPSADGHHRRNIRAGLRNTTVEIEEQAESWLPDWARLYDHLIHRHSIEGVARFSPESFARQFRLPGMLVARALADGRVLGMTLWAIHGDRAYYHLGAYDEQGYRARASYAMFSRVFEYLTSRGVREVGLGAGAGAQASSVGLERFKRGWATGTKQVYLCGRILNQEAYRAVCQSRGRFVTQGYFPAYRAA